MLGDIVFNSSTSTTNIFTINGSSTWTSSSTGVLSSSSVSIKRCRICNHAHIEGQSGCIDTVGFMVTIVTCACKEYVPTDNLEYLEWCYDKNKRTSK